MSTDMADSIEMLLDSLGVEDPELRQYMGQALSKDQAVPGSTGASAKTSGRLRDRVARSESLVQALLAKLEVLACALGACPACWGDDPDCEECGGLGKCGEFLPDRECFETYVVPVLKQLKADRSRRSDNQVYQQE